MVEDSDGGNRALTSEDSNASGIDRCVVWRLVDYDWVPDVVECGNDDAPLCESCHHPVFSQRSNIDEFRTILDESDRRCGECGGELQRKTPPPDELLSELGTVQTAVLAAMAELTDWVPFRPHLRGDVVIQEVDDPADHAAWVQRTQLSRVVADKYHSWNSANAATSSISRAVFGLIDQGVLKGAYRGWVTYSGAAGGGPTNPVFNTDLSYSQQGPTPATSQNRPHSAYDGHGQDRRPSLELVRFASREGQQASLLANYNHANGHAET